MMFQVGSRSMTRSGGWSTHHENSLGLFLLCPFSMEVKKWVYLFGMDTYILSLVFRLSAGQNFLLSSPALVSFQGHFSMPGNEGTPAWEPRNKNLLYNISGDSSLQYIIVVPSLPKLACLPWNLSCMYHGLSLLQTESMAPCTFQLPLSIHFPSWDAECYKEAMSPGMSTGGCCNRLMWSSPLPSMNSLVWLCECLRVLSNWCIEKPNVRPTPAPAPDPHTMWKRV